MNAETSAERVVRSAFPRVRELVDDVLAAYRQHRADLGALVRSNIEQGRREPNECSLPLLVHGAETGDPTPAVPIAAVHVLWWRAANAFDDIADGDTEDGLCGHPAAPMLMAAQDCGYVLPARLLTGPAVAEPVRPALLADFLDGWSAAVDGQIRDLAHEAGAVDPETVLTTYRRKSGAPYRMVAGMSARVAGAGADRIRRWRRFGTVLGLLRQLRNDAEDLVDERAEDLRNGTATYLLVSLLSAASGARRREFADQLERARHDPRARGWLRRELFDRGDLVRDRIGQFRAEAHELLDELVVGPVPGDSPGLAGHPDLVGRPDFAERPDFGAELRARVEAAAAPVSRAAC